MVHSSEHLRENDLTEQKKKEFNSDEKKENN
jgi:hypothetical protein